MTPVSTVPTSVAIGTTCLASSTLSAGTVADSRPRKPQKVSPAAAAMLPLATGTGACTTNGVPPSHSHAASAITASSGTSLISVVTSETSPA